MSVKGIMCEYPERQIRKIGSDVAWTQHYTRVIRLVDSHPKISMDYAGLTDVTDFTFLNDYDFVYLYLHPVEGGTCWWYEFPEKIRSYCKKLLLQFDYEGVMPELPPFIEKMINSFVDALLYNSPLPETRWNVTVPKYPFMIKQPVEETIKKVPVTSPEREQQSVGILWHAGTGCKIDRSIHLASYLQHPTKVFSAWLGMKQEFLEEYVRNVAQEFYNPETWTCYSFRAFNSYILDLNKCYLVLEDNENYYGFSRLAYTCSALKIPVVGSTNNLACMIAYPYTTTNPLNIQIQTQLCKRLFEDATFYNKVVDYAYKKMQKYMSREQLLKRFCKILTDLKVM